MHRVALDLRRASLVAFHQQAGGHAAERHRGGVEERLARDQLFGLLHVRDDLFLRLLRARRDAGERERRAHQFQKRAARDRIGDRLDLRGELVIEPRLERRVACLLLEAPPEFRAMP